MTLGCQVKNRPRRDIELPARVENPVFPGRCKNPAKNPCQTDFRLLYFPSVYPAGRADFIRIGVRTIGELRFGRDHIWVRMDDEVQATLGVTDYLQEKLGEIYSLRLPEEGEEFIKDESFSVIEPKTAAAT